MHDSKTVALSGHVQRDKKRYKKKDGI